MEINKKCSTPGKLEACNARHSKYKQKNETQYHRHTYNYQRGQDTRYQ